MACWRGQGGQRGGAFVRPANSDTKTNSSGSNSPVSFVLLRFPKPRTVEWLVHRSRARKVGRKECHGVYDPTVHVRHGNMQTLDVRTPCQRNVWHKARMLGRISQHGELAPHRLRKRAPTLASLRKSLPQHGRACTAKGPKVAETGFKRWLLDTCHPHEVADCRHLRSGSFAQKGKGHMKEVGANKATLYCIAQARRGFA